MTGLGPAKPLGLTFLDADRHPWVHKWVLLLSQKKRRKKKCMRKIKKIMNCPKKRISSVKAAQPPYYR